MLGEEGATEAACDGSTIEATTTGSESSNLIIECRARPPHSIRAFRARGAELAVLYGRYAHICTSDTYGCTLISDPILPEGHRGVWLLRTVRYYL
jgi:hypothetical protein